jgi:hypothetical protein
MLSIGWGGYSLPLVSGGASGCQDFGEPEAVKIFFITAETSYEGSSPEFD